jgi:toxin ParE1/3/4
MRIVWAETAIIDLEDIIEYISADSINIAIEKYTLIRNATNELKKYPEKGRIIPELEKNNIRKYREIIVKPWRIMYKREQKIVYIMAIIDGRRNIEDILMRRNLR